MICAKDAKEGVRVDATSSCATAHFASAAVVSVAGMLAGGIGFRRAGGERIFLYPVYLGAVLREGQVVAEEAQERSSRTGFSESRPPPTTRTNAGSASRTFSFDGYSTPPKSRRRAPRPRDTESLCSRVRSTQTTARTGSATPCATDSEAGGGSGRGSPRLARIDSSARRRAPLLFVLRFVPRWANPRAGGGRRRRCR